MEKTNSKFKNLIVRKSLGRNLYYGILNLSKIKKNKNSLCSNSSSGIKETAVFGCPTVNIGTRQKSRLRGSNVLDVSYVHKEIYNAIKKCLYDERFRSKALHTKNPYGMGNAGKKIAKFISKKIQLSKKYYKKK